MTAVNVIFTLGAVAFLAGLALIDYRLSMVVGGALAMWFSYLLGQGIIRRRQRTTAASAERSKAQ